MSSVNNLIAVVAGRSGGHIIPALTYTRQHYPEKKILFFATATEMDTTILTHHHVYRCSFMTLIDFPRKKWWLYPLFMVQGSRAFFNSLWIFLTQRPCKLISMGGYVSIPLVGAAWCARIPVELFELNAEPGLAIKVLTPLATKVHVCFESAQQFFPPRKVYLTSYPLRFSSKERLDTQQARQILKLPVHRTTLLVLGGSQGSQFINDMMMDAIVYDKERLQNLSIIHQTGLHECERVKAFYQQHGVYAEVFSFKDEMALYYAAADRVMCRAGAGTLFEVIFFRKRALVIPLETGTTAHQRENARAMYTLHPELIEVARQQELINNPQRLVTWLMTKAA